MTGGAPTDSKWHNGEPDPNGEADWDRNPPLHLTSMRKELDEPPPRTTPQGWRSALQANHEAVLFWERTGNYGFYGLAFARWGEDESAAPALPLTENHTGD